MEASGSRRLRIDRACVAFENFLALSVLNNVMSLSCITKPDPATLIYTSKPESHRSTKFQNSHSRKCTLILGVAVTLHENLLAFIRLHE
jgi:hypothetical protein